MRLTMIQKTWLLIALALYQHGLYAQQVRPATAPELYARIAQLQHLTRVLYLAAHPDDENTRLLGWLVNHQHIPTAYLSLTRGDGGQNILGSELGPALGLIRTHELLAARKLDGAGQFFTRAVDFGFSKNHAETFTHWDRQTVLRDMAWVVRAYRPDVIICRFPPNKLAGHGHHAASAVLAEELFEAAGDSTRFPDQLRHHRAWQPKRLLWNTFQFGNRNTTSEDQYKTDVGHYSPLLGMGYGELAGISRSIHKSQGAGTPSVPGIRKEYFSHVAGDSIRASFFDGIDITWNRVGRPEIGVAIEKILAQYDFRYPEKSLPALLQLRTDIRTVQDSYWRTEKLTALDYIILSAAGFMAEVTTAKQEATAGETLPFSLAVIARSETIPIYLESIRWPDSTGVDHRLKLEKDSLYVQQHKLTIPENTPLTQPYWLAETGTDDGHYPLPDIMLTGLPEAPNELAAILTLDIGGTKLNTTVPLSWKKLDPIKGDVIERLLLIPDISLDFSSPLIFVKTDGTAQAAVQVRAYQSVHDGTLTVSGGGFSRSVSGISFRAGTDTLIPLTLTKADVLAAGKEDIQLHAVFRSNHKTYSRNRHVIRYDHLPTLQYFTRTGARLLHRNWKTTVQRIAYIPGAGDHTAAILSAAGLQVDILSLADLDQAQKLKEYDAVITGIRIVNTRKEIQYRMPVLLEYVRNGGTLVMQYNNLKDMATSDLGPYPFTLTGKRVTEENAPVEWLLPQHRLLHHPNTITAADFDGWVQERGLYFPDPWDQRYDTPFRMHDSGETPLDGVTLYTPYGGGHYIYTSLAFFRQLPAGNKGALRLFMNMLSVGK